MEKFKIQVGKINKIENNIIDVVPNIVSSDMPYYAEIETINRDIVKLRNEYIYNKEPRNQYSVSNIKIRIGRKSGKVYEINIEGETDVKQLTSSIKELFKELTEQDVSKESRFYNNVQFTTNLLKKLNEEVRKRNKE